MKKSPAKKETTQSREDDLNFRPLPVQLHEPPANKQQFNYINSSQGFHIHNALIHNKVFSPLLTPRDARKKLLGESVFKTPHSRNLPSVEKKSNGLATPESRSVNKKTRRKNPATASVRFRNKKDLREPRFPGINPTESVHKSANPSRPQRTSRAAK